MEQVLQQIEQEIAEKFRNEYQNSPEMFIYSPGRVNIIGEHTDYNDGFVLPMAIDRYLIMAVSKRDDQTIRVFSTDFKQRIEFSIANIKIGEFDWGEYITGSIQGLKEQSHQLKGFDLVITANIPVGASLSSSAALELGILKAACYSSDIEWQPMEMALLGQKVENQWVGMNCGIMDQAISACGKEGHALLIDCRDLSRTPCPLPPNHSIIIMDTTTRRGLVDSAYNERREQCNTAAETMGVSHLRDATPELLEQHKNDMERLVYLRAKHIITENIRVLQTAEAMAQNDAAQLGKLMYESHCSLRDDFDVSGEALNVIVECAMSHPSCIGARMTGAGFAGCAVAMVEKGKEQDFVAAVSRAYAAKMEVEPHLYVCRASEGTSIKKCESKG